MELPLANSMSPFAWMVVRAVSMVVNDTILFYFPDDFFNTLKRKIFLDAWTGIITHIHDTGWAWTQRKNFNAHYLTSSLNEATMPFSDIQKWANCPLNVRHHRPTKISDWTSSPDIRGPVPSFHKEILLKGKGTTRKNLLAFCRQTTPNHISPVVGS